MSTVKIVTYNLRYVWLWTSEGINNFAFRAGLIYDKISKEKPDVIAFQEVVPTHLNILQKLLPEYEFYGHYRNADYTGEGLYTAIRKESFQLIAYETFWLSPTPFIPGSRFPDQSNNPRMCVVTTVRHQQQNRMLRLYNIHLDDISDAARIEGIKCVLSQMKRINDTTVALPSLILGDYNAIPESETIRFCCENKTPVIKDITEHIEMTYHDYGRAAQKIDYIFATEDIVKAVEKADIWKTCFNGVYLSDHYPVFADIDLDKIG
ncbi:MAG: endonuclease/exonuclease/phosphatase family protein [Clostridia bacterium]|nr:endonuclease/exonuclease/phosphatase family protein [Clostridia bacterium]